MHPNEQVWLVKSGDRILGPFLETTLIQKLLAREIVVIDEVARPGGRWVYIREEATFAATVAEIWTRSQGLREDTDIATLSNTDELSRADKTQTVTPLFVGGLKNPGQIVPVQEESVFEEKSELHLPSSDLKSEKKFVFSVWWLLAIVALGFDLWVIWHPQENEYKPAVSSFGKIAAEALQKDRLGDFAGSLKLLRLAHQLRPSDPDISLRLALLSFRIDHQSVEAKRIVNETLALNHDPEHVAQGQTILALITKSEGDFQESERLLKDSLKLQPASVAASFNLGALYFSESKWAQAQDAFTQTLGLDSSLNLARVMWSLVQLRMGPEAQAVDLVPTLTSGPLQQEQLLIQASLHPSAAALKRVFLKDPFLTDEYRVDPILDTTLINWKNLISSCEKIAAATPESGLRLAFLIVCRIKAGQKAEAAKLAANSMATRPGDVSLLEANAFMLLDFGKDEEAQGSLQLAMRQSSDLLSSVLMARACKESQDAICEREQWRRVLEKDPESLPALVNLARLEYESGNKKEAQFYFDKARPNSSDYLPWLQLNESMGSSHP
jgi:tetratricopeptide (TPR) repeat protein